MIFRSILAFAISAAFLATPAGAGNVELRVTLTGGGSLSLTHTAVLSTGASLNGLNQELHYSVPLTVTDTRSSGVGWNITLTSTSLHDSSGNGFAPNASSIMSTRVQCLDPGGCTSPRNLIDYPLTMPADMPAPAPIKIFNADQNSGLGQFSVTPTVSVTIPGNARAGNYVSDLAVAIVSGP